MAPKGDKGEQGGKGEQAQAGQDNGKGEQAQGEQTQGEQAQGEQTKPAAGGVADIKSIGDSLADAMPDVQEHAIMEESQKAEKAREQWADLRDTDGHGFDPEIHRTDSNGNPVLSARGKLVKKPGRKSGGKSQKAESVVGGKPKAQTPEEAAKVSARASGAMAANLLITLGVVVGGEEWRPMTNPQIGVSEKDMLESAFADYFEATGRTDIPPGLALTVAIGGYVLPRFTMPKTIGRMGKIKAWVARKLADRKLKKYGLKAQVVDNKPETEKEGK